MSESRLCVILDGMFLSGERMFKVAAAALAGGATMLQLRDKSSPSPGMIRTARRLSKIARKAGALFMVNDRPEVALAARADGAHLGQGDLSIKAARRLLGGKRLIGVSVAGPGDALKALRGGADYLGAGAVFRTPIKKGRMRISDLRKIAGTGLPVFAIGGITAENIAALATAGVRRAAVIRAVCSSRNPRKSTERLALFLKKI